MTSHLEKSDLPGTVHLMTTVTGGDPDNASNLEPLELDRYYIEPLSKASARKGRQRITIDFNHSADAEGGAWVYGEQWVGERTRDWYAGLNGELVAVDEWDDRDEAWDVSSQDAIDDLLKVLTPRQLEVVRLRVWERLSFGEIAEQLGLSSRGGIKVHYERALERLRKAVGDGVAAESLRSMGLDGL